jgi:hypothetical protein
MQFASIDEYSTSHEFSDSQAVSQEESVCVSIYLNKFWVTGSN